MPPPHLPQADAPLARRTLALAHQKAPVDARAEQILGRIARYRTVVPRVLLQRVHRRHIVGGHPADLLAGRVRFAPLARLVVRQDAHVLVLAQAQLVLAARREIVQRDKQLRIIVLGAGRQ